MSFLATGSFMERLLFSVMRSDRQYLDGILDLLMESDDDDDDFQYAHIGKEKVRAVTRMLLVPSKSEKNVLRRMLATGPTDAPFEALIMPYQDRLLSDVKLLHSVYSFIPRTRAPPVSVNLYYSYISLALSHTRVSVTCLSTEVFWNAVFASGKCPLFRQRLCIQDG